MKAAVSRQTDTPLRAGREERNGYGYQVWRTRDGFSLYGVGGQMGICMPGKGLVLCTLADTMKDEQGVQPIYDAFFEHLSHIDTYPASPEDRKALDLRLAALKLSCLPTCEEQVHPGVLHLINADPGLPFHTLSVHDHELVFEGEACWHLPFSDTAWIPGTFPQTDVPCYTHAAWTAPDTFCLHCELTGTWTGSMQLLMVIRDRTATLQVQSRIWELLPGWQGTAFGKWS